MYRIAQTVSNVPPAYLRAASETWLALLRQLRNDITQNRLRFL